MGAQASPLVRRRLTGAAPPRAPGSAGASGAGGVLRGFLALAFDFASFLGLLPLAGFSPFLGRFGFFSGLSGLLFPSFCHCLHVLIGKGLIVKKMYRSTYLT